jgi:phosphopantetheinyl transferase
VEAGETPDERNRRFAAVWTCKEAWGKALGVGYLYDLQSTAFRPKKRPWQQYGFTFRHLDLGDTCLTLCAGSALRLRRVRFAHLRACLSEETT